MNAKISCLPVSLYPEFFSGDRTIPQWSAQGAALGLGAVDINALFLREKSLDEIRQIRQELTVPVLMVSAYSDFTLPDPQERAKALETAKEDIRRAAAVGAKYIRLTAGQHYPDQDEAEAIRYIYEGFEACIPVAQEAGVGILLENHSKPGAWTYNDFDYHYERMLKLWDVMKELPIGANYDTANAFALNHWKELLDAFGDRIETIHVNDLASIQPLQFACIGEGITPLEEQMAALIAAGFRGPVCIEEAGMDGKAGIRRSVNYTREVLNKVLHI